MNDAPSVLKYVLESFRLVLHGVLSMLGQSGRYSSNSAITLVALLVLTSLSPMAFADDDAEDQNYRIGRSG